MAEAQTLAAIAAAIVRTFGNHWFLGFVLDEQGKIARLQGEDGLARSYFAESLTLREALGDAGGMALSLHHLGETALAIGDYGEAQRLYARSVALYGESNDPGGLATAYKGFGDAAAAQHEYAAAQAHYRQALQLAAAVAYVPLLVALLVAVGELLVQTKRKAQGIALLAAALRHPASDHATRLRARQILDRVGGAVPDPAMAPSPDLDALVRLALAYLTA